MKKTNAEKVIQEIRSQVTPGQKIVFVSGNFNIVHPGHLRLLNYAAECGEYLVVGVNKTGHVNDIYVPIDLRLESVSCLEMVDYAFSMDEAPADFIKQLRPDVVIKGKEYETRFNAEEAAVESYGGRLLFSSGDVKFSSLDLARKELSQHTHQILEWPEEYRERHKINMEDLKKILLNFKNKRVVVIGDIIVDEYVMCNPLGMSQEDPTLVVMPVLTQQFLGGAGIVAAHARGLGADVRFYSVVGKDDTAVFAKEKLDEYGVEATLFEDHSRPTSLKTRYRAKSKTLLRVNRLGQQDIGDELRSDVFEKMKDICSAADVVIFSDFNYGCLPQTLVDELIQLCQGKNIPMFGDSQSSSQLGDISRFKNMRAITPTEREARLALHDFNSGLAVVAHALKSKALCENVVMTLGDEGVLIHSSGHSHENPTDILPAFNNHPKDVSGAGDSFLTALSLAMVSGGDIWQSCFIASIAAGLQISRVGNVPLKSEEILHELDRE